MEIVKINTEFIKLGQVLKLSGLVDSGAHAKILIAEKQVKVNNLIEVQRGKKIIKGDMIEVIGVGTIKVE
jgi:ribosome-associated protein